MLANAVVSPRDLLGRLTPSEVALTFADRFLPSVPEKRLWGYRVITSGRYVTSPDLAAFMAEVVVGALVDAGDVALVERPARFLLWTRPRPALQLSVASAAGDRWPAGSPERLVLDWLRSRRDDSAHRLREVLAEALIGEPSAGAHRAILDVGHRSLARLQLTAMVTRTTWKVVRYEELVVDEPRAAALARASEAEVIAALASHRALSDVDRERIRRAWAAAAAAKTPND